MRLRYIGPDPGHVGVVPLPEGWPAADHDESDDSIAEAKCATGLYEAPRSRRRAWQSQHNDNETTETQPQHNDNETTDTTTEEVS